MERTQYNLNENEQETILPFNVREEEKNAAQQYENKDYFYSLAEKFYNAKIVNGTAQDFINLSISFKESGDDITACRILERGLDIYNNDIELLACYLDCVIDSGIEKELIECEKFYVKIRENPLESYSENVFNSILKYLVTKISFGYKREAIKSEAEEILKVFDKQHPNREGSYIAHYKFIDGREQQKSKLREAVNKLSSCPRCALTLADMLCDEGEYEDACNVIEKCLRSVQSLPMVNRAYAYYLQGICKYGIFQKLDFIEDRELKVKEIYDTFRIAASEYYNLKRIHRKEIERIVYVLEQQTEIFY